MFAGKTELLLKEISRAEYGGKQVQVFKPAIDDRWESAGTIRSHSAGVHEATIIEQSIDILDFLDPNTQVVAIEEIQFFDPEIIDVVLALLEADVRVVFAGLSQDFRGEPFGSMPELLSLCDEIDKPTAICTEKINGGTCGQPATKTQRIVNGEPANYNDPIVLIGAEQEYQARCVKHHKVPGKPNPKLKAYSK